MKQIKRKVKTNQRIPIYAIIIPLIIGIIFITLGFIFIVPNFGIFGYVWIVISILIISLPIIRTIQINHKLKKGIDITTFQDVTNDDVATGFENNVYGNVDTSSRLKELEKLYQENLITKEEYDKKRKEIIDKI